MKYRVHRLEVKEDTAQEKLENFLNKLDGDVLSIAPFVAPTLLILGGAAKVNFYLIVEKTK